MGLVDILPNRAELRLRRMRDRSFIIISASATPQSMFKLGPCVS